MALREDEQGIIVGFSGGASTMQAVYEATRDGRLPKTKIVGAFSSNPNAGGLSKAAKFESLDPQQDVVFLDPSLPSYGHEIIAFFKERQDRFSIFCQYGLEPFTPEIVIDWLEANGKDGINQHGGAVNPDAWDFGGYGMSCSARFHAARLMFVKETDRFCQQFPVAQGLGKNYDEGVVYRRGMVPIFCDDTVESLTERAIKNEWEVQIQALQDFENGQVQEMPPIPELVRVHERPLLQLVKRIAMRLYDKDGNKRGDPKFEDIFIGADMRWASLDYIKKLVSHLESQA